MRHCVCGIAAAIAAVWLATIPVIGQTPTATPAAHGETAWTPPLTPDGQPDIQGMWEGGWGFDSRDHEPGVKAPQTRIGPAGVDCAAISREKEGLRAGAGTVCASYVPLFNGVIEEKANFGKGTGGGGGSTSASRPRGLLDVPEGTLPWTSAGAAHRADIVAHFYDPPGLEYVDPSVRCVPTWQLGGAQILQIPGYVVLLIESNHATRIIPVDGRPHLRPEIALYQGDSVGHWEGTTLVVDTTNFKGTGWFDMVGTPESEAMHVIERFKIVDADTMDYIVTIDDRKLFTRPWTFANPMRRAAAPEAQGLQTNELLEHACAEGSRGLENSLERPERPLPPEQFLPR